MNKLRTLILALLMSGAAHAEEPLVEVESGYPFGETVARLRSWMQAADLTVFAEIDHAAGAEAAGMKMPPTTLLIYGNPKGGTPLMLEDPHAALDLPLRVLVREDGKGHVLVGYHPVSRLAAAQSLLERAIAKTH